MSKIVQTQGVRANGESNGEYSYIDHSEVNYDQALFNLKFSYMVVTLQ